jgi:hypothetical protein
MIGEQEFPELLKALSEDVFDASATLGKNEPLPVRLVGFRVDEKTAARHRQNLCKAAKKHGIEVNGEISSVSVSSLRCIQRDTFKKLVQQEQLQMVGKFGRQKMEN